MTSPHFLHLKPQDYDVAKLAQLKSKSSDTYFLEVLTFMESWLNGVSQFTFNTSGSTGKPKKILHSRAMMILSAKNTIEALNLKSEDTALACMDIKFIGGAMMLVRVLVNQMPLIIVPPSKNPLSLPIPNFDFAAMVPMQLQAIKENNELSQLKLLDNCKVLILGGSSVSSAIKPWVKALKCQIFETYGMTETVSHIALKLINGNSIKNHFVGVGDIRFDTDASGKLMLNGSITSNIWLKTNDIAKIITDREFQWLGRADFTINSGGIKIQPEELESQLTELLRPYPIESYAIVGQPDKEYGERVTLVIESTSIVASDELLQELKKNASDISNKKFPKSVVILEHLPRTASQKIDRRAIIRLISQKTNPNH